MKQFTLPTIFILLAVIIPLAGCSSFSPVTGSGNVITQKMDYGGFTSVDVSTGFKVDITQSDSYSIIITADDSLFESLKVIQQNDTLKIYLDPIYSHAVSIKKAKITMPVLEALTLSSGAKGSISGFESQNDFTLNMSLGSGLTGSMKAEKVKMNLASSTTATLQGSANIIILEASAVSHANLDDFTVNEADIKLSSGSVATVTVMGDLDADLSSGSRLYYLGSPVIGDVTITGGSTMKSK